VEACTVDVVVTYDLEGNTQNGQLNVGNAVHWYESSTAPSLSPGCDPQFPLNCPELEATCGYQLGQIKQDEVERMCPVSCGDWFLA
jgi:hypothetical protein